MKNRVLFFLAIFFVAGAFTFTASEPENSESAVVVAGGIKFSKMGFGEAVQEARETGRLVFIDVHTSWCGPCKEMARTTFQSEEVGKLFNEKFINLKIDAEKDTDGPMVSKKYGVAAYPTLLFINGKGKIVRKLVGFQPEGKLISVANKL